MPSSAPDSPPRLRERVRWGNVAAVAATLIALVLVVAWPRLGPPESTLPAQAAAPAPELGPDRPGAPGDRHGSAVPGQVPGEAASAGPTAAAERRRAEAESRRAKERRRRTAARRRAAARRRVAARRRAARDRAKARRDRERSEMPAPAVSPPGGGAGGAGYGGGGYGRGGTYRPLPPPEPSAEFAPG